MNKRSNTNRPTHTIWQVQGEGERARWTRVGVGWLHEDQKGASLKFDSFPLNGRIVVREVSAQDDAAEPTAPEFGGAE